MANPQVEKGYLRISLELFEALCRIRISGTARQVLDVIIRQTYGWRRKEDTISLRKFRRLTGITDRSNLVRGIRTLEKRNIITIVKEENETRHTYCIQKNYTEWKPLSKTTTNVVKNDNKSVVKNDNKRCQKRQQTLSKMTTSVVKNDNKTLSKLTTPLNNKDTQLKILSKVATRPFSANSKNLEKTLFVANPPDVATTPIFFNSSEKEEKKKSKGFKISEDSNEFHLSKDLLDFILERNSGFKKPNLQEWARHIDKMVRIDGRGYQDIYDVIKFSQQDEFWQNNILSTRKLRQQFDQLYLKLKQKRENRS